MNKFLFLVFVSFCIGFAPLSAYADGPFDIAVPSNCTVTDTVGVSHTFPQDGSPSDYLGICALAEALAGGYVSDVDFVDFGFGLFVDNLNNVAKPENSYWQLRLNGVGSGVGVADLSLSVGDTMSFVLTAFDPITYIETSVIPEQSIHLHSIALEGSVVEETLSSSGDGGGASGGIPNSRLDVAAALAYLASAQREDGSFGSPMLSDWVAIAFSAALPPGDAKEKLREYLRAALPPLASITDYERHAMALSALGINPYSGTPVDYIAPIVRAFDGTQIGDAALDNDDIFALFPLLAAGYSAYDKIIQKTTAFILSRQGSDGSWDGSVDMTAAAIQALVPVRVLPDVSLALIRAEGYLRSQKPGDNSFSASWARQAISALSWTPSGWTPTPFTEDDRLAGLQQADGGVEPESSGIETRVWATAYAIPAALGKSWPMLLQPFMKPASPEVLEKAEGQEATSTITESPVAPAALVEKPDVPPPPPPAAAEIPTNPELPALVNGQSAAAAGAPVGAFFSRLWSAAVSLLTAFL